MPGRCEMSGLIQRGWLRPGWINWLLYPLSLIYSGLMFLRRQAYRSGLLKSYKLRVPVIVVGNISVGGTGKTPLVIELVEQLKLHGMNPGVISRGYGGVSCLWPREVDRDATAAEVGDEPILISRRCQVPVVVGPNRVRSAHVLIEKHLCNVIVSDDGFQHHALQRDLDIVLIDGQRRFGNGWCLPAGPLREPVSALRRAGIVVTNQAGTGEKSRDGEFAMRVHISQAIQIGGDQTCDLGKFAGKTVHVVAAIGNPDRFFEQLQAQGIDVVSHRFRDHHAFTSADLDFAAADRDIVVLMTEKDAVKCESMISSDQFWMVPLEATLDPAVVAEVLARMPVVRTSVRM